MPLRYSDLARATKTATLDVGEAGSIHFAFHHGLITPKLMADFAALDEAQIKAATVREQTAAILAISEHLARLIAEWDVLEEDGETMFPLTAERLAADIPLTVQIQLLQLCMAEMSVGETAPAAASANGHASAAGSPPMARSASRRRGMP